MKLNKVQNAHLTKADIMIVIATGFNFSLTTVHCFDNSYVGKQPVAWKDIVLVKRTPGKQRWVH